MSGETVTKSSSGNNTSMLIYNGNDDDCSYDKWEIRLLCGLQLKASLGSHLRRIDTEKVRRRYKSKGPDSANDLLKMQN